MAWPVGVRREGAGRRLNHHCSQTLGFARRFMLSVAGAWRRRNMLLDDIATLPSPVLPDAGDISLRRAHLVTPPCA